MTPTLLVERRWAVPGRSILEAGSVDVIQCFHCVLSWCVTNQCPHSCRVEETSGRIAAHEDESGNDVLIPKGGGWGVRVPRTG
jgi:hypothetical protein